MIELFKKYKIGSFITLALLSSLFFIDQWNIYYGIFDDNPYWFLYVKYGQSTIFFGVFLAIYALYLRSIYSPLFYNKSLTFAFMFFVPYFSFFVLSHFEIFIPKSILLGLYFLFIFILFLLYIKNYDNLLPKDPLKEKVFSDKSLIIEFVISLLVYIFLIFLINEHFLICLSYSIFFSLIYYLFFTRKGKKTYLDEYFKSPLKSVLLYFGFIFILISEMGIMSLTAFFWSIVLIYFFFIRPRFIRKLDMI